MTFGVGGTETPPRITLLRSLAFGLTPEPELHTARVWGRGGGRRTGDSAEEAGRKAGRAPTPEQREPLVTVRFFSIPKDLSLHFIDFFLSDI